MSSPKNLSHREVALMEALQRLGGSGRSAELAKILNVSEETVRRSIKSLAKAGMVERVHGGAYLSGPQAGPSFFRRMGEDTAEKKRIAEVTLPRIQDGMTVFLDVGSTTAFVAEALRLRRDLVVVTNSIGVAQLLVNHNGNRLHFLGGEMSSDERGTFGPVTEQQAGRFAFDVAVLSADAVSAKHGLLFHNAGEAQLSMAVTQETEQVIVVTAHSKFGESAPHRGSDPHELDLLVSDREPGKRLARAMAEWGCNFVLADVAKAGG